MKSIVLLAIINKATEKAEKNASEWMESDHSAYSGLRSGIREARVNFLGLESVEEKYLRENKESYKSPWEVSEEYSQVLLKAMLTTLQSVFEYYRSFPGSEGEWECSALSIIEDEIKELIATKYIPTHKELKIAEEQLL